jgi:hypothetical protein
MIEVDRAMTETFRIELIQMMENAGRNLAHLARERFFNGNPRNKKVVVLADTGGPTLMFNLAAVFIAATLATSGSEPFLPFIRIYAKYGRT